MTDSQVLILLLAALYLGDCLWLLHRNSLAITGSWRGDRRLRTPSVTAGNRQQGFVLLNPLPPLEPSFACHPLPVSLTQDFALSYIPQALTEESRPRQRRRLVELDGLQSVIAAGRLVKVDGRAFVDCASEQSSRHVAALLRRLADADAAERGELLREVLEASFDTDRVETVVADLEQRSKWLRSLSTALLAVLLLVVPLAALRFGVLTIALPALAVVLPLVAVICVLFWRLHRRFHPHSLSQRIEWVLMMAVCPPVAARALDGLSRELLSGVHPLAAAAVLCDRKDFESLAKRYLLDLRYPVAPELDEPEQLDVETRHRQMMIEAVERFLGSRGIDLATLERPPEVDDPAAGWYCPRCRTAFRIHHELCPDCGSHALRAYEGVRK